MRLNVLDPRWIEFGFNQPGAASTPEVPAGRPTEPLFVTVPLEPGTEYLVYVSPVKQGAESDFSARTSAAKEA